MSDLLVLTMNGGGDWIPCEVQRSHQCAASRWGADYLQIVDVPTDQHFRLKHEACEGISDYSRVCWIDGDAVVREDCPSPFGIVPPDTFGGVENALVDPDRQHWVQEYYWKFLSGDLSAGEYGLRPYINGGVFVFTPDEHRGLFRVVVDRMRRYDVVEAMVEQTLFNMAIQHQGLQLSSMPRGFNWMGPEVWNGGCPGYIAHFAQFGREYRDEDRAAIMEHVVWRVPSTTSA